MGKNHHTSDLIEEMNRYYEARAPWHDQYMSYRSPEEMEAREAPIVRTFEQDWIGRNILELACGTGNWTQLLAKRASSVVALDISPSSLEIAREKSQNCSNIEFQVGDAYALGPVLGSFDTIFAADFWSHIPLQMLPEFVRSLSKYGPGETVTIIDMLWRSAFGQEPNSFDAGGNRIFTRHLPDGSQYHVIKNFPDESDLRELLANVATDIRYFAFPKLERWALSFQL